MNILVTGGASGLGEAITRKLAAHSGNTIYFTFFKSHKNAQKIETEFSNTRAINCNFGNTSELKALTNKISEFDLDVLINNAYNSEGLKTHFHKQTSDDYLNDFKENIIPVIEITQATIIAFRKKKQGKVITILTAYLACVPPIGWSVYVANKAYLEKLTKVWATENVKFNISSNSISPSVMLTPLNSQVDERVMEQIIDQHPYKKLLTVEEVAQTAAFLVNASPQINGIDILMNAGATIK